MGHAPPRLTEGFPLPGEADYGEGARKQAAAAAAAAAVATGAGEVRLRCAALRVVVEGNEWVKQQQLQ